MARVVLPRVQAMVVCDAVEESEHEAGVYHLTNVRTVIESPFPAVVSRLCVFAHMSGHQSEATIHFEIERAETSDVIFETAPESVSFDEPTSVVGVVIPLVNCVFPVPGYTMWRFTTAAN
jgi:hypothetical protein